MQEMPALVLQRISCLLGDCLGHIEYFDGNRTDSKGNPGRMVNVICLHEQDDGLQYKHTTESPAGHSDNLHDLELRVHFRLHFRPSCRDRARGAGHWDIVLSNSPLDNENGETVPWGTNVGPGVMAAFHQHMFSYRIDLAIIDGLKNIVYYDNARGRRQSFRMRLRDRTNNDEDWR
ncbi:hypothetical protein VTN77DRAFT_1725 [Rasamsonia byssochlamydoides]|uniref:uncharacterized protein n=1 Tax=Rasamsonia byssochlamydoides TaxID=89139 RepID=UPI0037433013